MINSLQASQTHPNPGDKNDVNIFNAINQILYPLVQGCETKDVKVVRLCLGLMQRLIVHKVLDFKGIVGIRLELNLHTLKSAISTCLSTFAVLNSEILIHCFMKS